MSPEQSKKILHSALLAAGRTLSLDDLLGLFANNATAPARSDVKELLDELERDLAEHVCELKLVASGYRLQIREEFSAHLSSLWAERPARYSRALHETLALIAYRQPITRGEIEDIRGVSVSSTIIKTLLEREWIRAVGHRDVPGRPAIYGTTRAFLDNFNLESLEALPPLAEIRDLDTVSDDLFAKTAVQGDDARPASAAVPGEDGPPADASDDAPAVDADQQPTAESSSDEHGVSQDTDALSDDDAQSVASEPASVDDALDADETETGPTDVSEDADAGVSQLTSERESTSQELEVEDHYQVADDESIRDGVEVVDSAGDNASPAHDDSLGDASTRTEDEDNSKL